MEYIIAGIIIVALIAVGAIYILRKMKNQKQFPVPNKILNIEKTNSKLMSVENEPVGVTIQMDMLPAELIPDENKLVEITDSKVLAHINNLLPGLAQTGNAVNNVVQAAQASGEVLYRAIIPAGAKLTNSHAMEGAVRGIYHGADGIKGHANLIAVEAQKGTAVVANTVAAAMGVASMVVGQYYMTQINAQLNEINDVMSKISDFQDNEYRSKVFSLMVYVKEVSDFQVEILENNELRFSKIVQLDNLEKECTQLLGQANLTLAGFASKKNLSYKEYEKELKKAQSWYIYQKSLLDILYKISELRYTLNFGKVSREQCVALLPTYTQQVEDTQSRLTKWHQETVKRLNIDTEEFRRIGGVGAILNKLNDGWGYKSIEKSTINMINTQVSGHKEVYIQDTTDLYADDVQLISKNGKLYYLPLSDIE